MHRRVARGRLRGAGGAKRERLRRRREGGFILSTEAILIFTILAIGLFAGLVAVRDALIKYNRYRGHNRFMVADSSDPPILLGQVVGFDAHETPLVPFVDYDPDGEGVNYRALIGVRHDRFTSRQPVFYTDGSCGADGGNVCLAAPASEDANAFFAGTGVPEAAAGAISYLYAMQPGLSADPGSGHSYGIGRGGANGVGGVLYRSTAAECPAPIASVWYSQRPTSDPGELCSAINPAMSETPFVLAAEVTDAAAQPVLGALQPPFQIGRVAGPHDASYTDPAPETPPP